MSKQEEVKIAAEREEIKRAKTLKASAPRKVGGAHMRVCCTPQMANFFWIEWT